MELHVFLYEDGNYLRIVEADGSYYGATHDLSKATFFDEDEFFVFLEIVKTTGIYDELTGAGKIVSYQVVSCHMAPIQTIQTKEEVGKND